MRSDSSRKFDAIKNFDLNLLIVFEMVYLHKSMTKAATKMQVTPSAISQSLQKLRTYFDDSLFIRENNLLRATLLANELHHQYALGFTPSALDGKMHALELHVKGEGMTARARKNYLARGVR